MNDFSSNKNSHRKDKYACYSDGAKRAENLALQSALLQCLFRSSPNGLTLEQIHNMINQVRKVKICHRTVRRHLLGMANYGFVKMEKFSSKNRGRSYYIYHASEPYELNAIIDRANKEALAIRTDGKFHHFYNEAS